MTYNETGHVDFSHLLDVYDEASAEMNVEAGRLLAENLQDQSARTALALAGWRPSKWDMAAQAVEYWNWGSYGLSCRALGRRRELTARRLGVQLSARAVVGHFWRSR